MAIRLLITKQNVYGNKFLLTFKYGNIKGRNCLPLLTNHQRIMTLNAEFDQLTLRKALVL
ncbi:hypothetical protein AO382_1341 [Moraxella catarrhalis]|uniref:Uncharacterized protein n=1 Tax=Moraxella catarrhalis TaxID=480 RepID=A0A7Z0UYE3_MORCA|nr:hypothetical protein AO382_1341 [Moraxella catarrhalis]